MSGATAEQNAGMAHITVDGRALAVRPGQTIAAALLAAGVLSWRRTRQASAPRGLYCGIGVCFDCLLTVNGRPGVRACLAQVHAGDEVVTEEGSGHGGLAV